MSHTQRDCSFRVITYRLEFFELLIRQELLDELLKVLRLAGLLFGFRILVILGLLLEIHLDFFGVNKLAG